MRFGFTSRCVQFSTYSISIIQLYDHYIIIIIMIFLFLTISIDKYGNKHIVAGWRGVVTVDRKTLVCVCVVMIRYGPRVVTHPRTSL